MSRPHLTAAFSAALVFVGVVAYAQDAGTAAEPKTLDAATLRKELGAKGKKQPILIDVRSPEEFAAEHIPGAINIPFKDDPAAFVAAFPRDAKKRPLRMYCNGMT